MTLKENTIKLNKEYLEKINLEDSLKYFGSWINNIEELSNQFNNAEPFEHLIIPNFLNEEYAQKINSLFPKNYDNWYKYENPFEVKYAFDKIDELPEDLKIFFYLLSSNQIIDIISKICKIPDLTYDEYLHGAGLHAYPYLGRLGTHLDYEKHPITGKERRLNIIYYLSKDWDNSWGGSTELWDNELKNVKKSMSNFNTAILFKTNDISWHGVTPICKDAPKDKVRQSLAYYYVSPLQSKKNEFEYRKKADFTILSNNMKNIDEDILKKLRKIRCERIITKNDMDKFLPNWTIFD